MVFSFKVIHTLPTRQGGSVRACWWSEGGSTPAEVRRFTGERSHGKKKNSQTALSIAGAEPAGGRQGRPVPAMGPQQGFQSFP